MDKPPVVAIINTSPDVIDASSLLLFQHLVSLPSFAGRPIVLTTTNKKQVDALATGSEQRIFEIVGTPHNLTELSTKPERPALD